MGRKSGFTEEQIIRALQEVDAGAKATDVCRRLGVTETTFYRWKSKYGGMRPPARRQAVGFLQADFKVSERRACRVLGVSRAAHRYRSIRPVPTALLEKLKAHATARPRWGYRRLHVLLRRDGQVVNHKRVYRLYRTRGSR
jgi:transposase